MTDLEVMKEIGKVISFKTRLICVLFGFSCLFFPGATFLIFSRSVVKAFHKFDPSDRAAFLTALMEEN